MCCLVSVQSYISLVPRPLPNFLHGCEIKSGSGLGMRLELYNSSTCSIQIAIVLCVWLALHVNPCDLSCDFSCIMWLFMYHHVTCHVTFMYHHVWSTQVLIQNRHLSTTACWQWRVATMHGFLSSSPWPVMLHSSHCCSNQQVNLHCIINQEIFFFTTKLKICGYKKEK